jgi:hypothetical protein
MGAYEIFSFIGEIPVTCAMACKIRKTSSHLFNYCLEKNSGNFYITQFVMKILGGMESTNIFKEYEK